MKKLVLHVNTKIIFIFIWRNMKTKIVYVVTTSDTDIYFEQAWLSAWSVRQYEADALSGRELNTCNHSGLASNSV